jgi:hypothetical protein
MSSAYSNCQNLTTAVCGPNVTNMSSAYYGCTNLTTAACGPNVTNMSSAYSNCQNLTTAVCGPNVTDMSYAYQNCSNLRGNVYFYANSISNVAYCFSNRNHPNRLNIYVHSGTTTNTRIHYTDTNSIIGQTITWTDAGNYRYNTAFNTYIYPVANVKVYELEEYSTDKFVLNNNDYVKTNDLITKISTEYIYATNELSIDSGFAYSINIDKEKFDKLTINSMEVK